MPRPAPLIGINGKKLAVITPSLLCNYDCSYCRIKSKTRAADEREMEDWLLALKSIGSPIVHVAGGEPTILRGFDDFVLEYQGLLRMTTNLSRKPQSFNPNFWGNFDYLTLSYHPEYISFEEFRDRAKYIVDLFAKSEDEAPRLACTIVAHPNLLGDIEYWIKSLCDVGINARGQYFNAPAGSSVKTYTDEQIQAIKRMGIPMSSNNAGQDELDSPTLKLCNAGMYYTHINRRGDARRCSRDNMSLGNIFDGTFSWLETECNCDTPCTEACDRSFSKFSTIKLLNTYENHNQSRSQSEFVNEIGTDVYNSWVTNGTSKIEVVDGNIIIKRCGGALEKQCVQAIITAQGLFYKLTADIISTSHECIIRINGNSTWKGSAGHVDVIFQATGRVTIVEILPIASWNAEVIITFPSIKQYVSSIT